MKNLFRNIFPVVVIAVIVGLLLGLTYQLIEPQLAAAEKKETENSLRQVISSAVSFNEVMTNGQTYYIAFGSDGTQTGFVFKTSEKGYGGPVVSLVGITNGAVEKVFILQMDKETPGLGTKARDLRWLEQFSGLTVEKIPQNKQGFIDNGLDAISGATLTSIAVANDIRDAFLIYASLSDLNKSDEGAVKKKQKRKKRAVSITNREGGNEN